MPGSQAGGGIPPRPQFFSPVSAEERAILADWDAKYSARVAAGEPVDTAAPAATPAATTPPVGNTRTSTPYMEANGTNAGSSPIATPPALTGDYRGSGVTPAMRNGITPMNQGIPPAGMFGATIGSMTGGAKTGRAVHGPGTNGGSGFPTNAVDNAAQGNYTGGMKLSDYLNPAAGWARDEGLNAVKSSYAGAGNFLSGAAMKGISDYTSKSALNSAWQPAFNNYMTDKNFNYGVDFGDRAFNYGANKDLAQLGLQGTQGQASSNSWLAGLLAQLAQSAGQTQGAGTIGQNNALTTAIAGALGNYQQGDILKRLGIGG